MNTSFNYSNFQQILIVDDTPENLNLLSEILSSQGYKVHLAPSGKLALKFLEFNLPDLILLDIMMPQLDGYQVCRAIKTCERTQDIPIIFLSALQEVLDKVRAFSLGAVDYITKPFEYQDVLIRVKTQLRLRKFSKQLLEQNYQLTAEIAERKRVEELVKQQKEVLQTIFDHVPVLLALFDKQNQIQWANRAWKKILGWTIEDLKNRDWLAEFYPDSPDTENLSNHLEKATSEWRDFKIFISEKECLEIAWAFILLSSGERIGIGQYIRDRKQAQDACILEERNRMAREIHDTLAQAFTGIIIHLAAALQVMNRSSEEAITHVQTVQNLAKSGLAEARRSVAALRPQLLEEGDLCNALNCLMNQMKTYTNAILLFNVVGTPYFLLTEVENHLLRIGQEALTNAIKYANASILNLELAYEPTQLILRVQDNGQGFDFVSVKNGFGILGMSERAERIGGTLTIESQLGQGTSVIVCVQCPSEINF